MTVASDAGVRTRQRAHTPFYRKYPFVFALALAIALLVANLMVEPTIDVTAQLTVLAPIALAAMASTPAIVSGRGGLDISIGPLMILLAVLFAAVLAPAGFDSPLAFVVMAIVGALVGALNGWLIVWLRLPAVVVTLSTYFVVSGISLKIAPSPVSVDVGWINALGGNLGPVPGALVLIGVPLVLWYVFIRSIWGRQLLAVGSNDATALSSGVNVARVRIMAYAIGGFIAAFGAVAVLALVRLANPGQSASYTLMALAAVALGGTSLLGGRGGLLGSLIGAACIFLMRSLLTVLQVNQAWLGIFYGGLLIVAVLLGANLTRRKDMK